VASTEFYRYLVDPLEVQQIMSERRVQSRNLNGTWFTTRRYEDPAEAQRELALRNPPTHRVGPIPAERLPDFDIPVRPVAPAHGQPGGGVEARTRGAVHLPGLLEFGTSSYLV